MIRALMIGVVTACFLWMPIGRASAQVQTSLRDDVSVGRYIDPIAGITIEQAVAMSLEREPDLLAIRTRVDAMRGLRQQAGLRPNPTISGMHQEQVGGPDSTTSTEIEWPLDLFRRAGRIAVADREVEAAQLSVADRRRLLAADIRSAYGELLATVRALGLTGELIAVNRRGYELLRARVDQGASPPLERNIAEVELRRIESQQWSLAARADAALIELKRLLGLDARANLKARDTLDAVVRGLSPAVVPTDLTTVGSERPDVREAEARRRLADARLDAARRDGRFDVSVTGGYMRMAFGFSPLGFGPSGAFEPIRDLFHSVRFGAMVRVPVGNRNQGAIATAEAERAGAEHQRQARALAAQSEVASATTRDERARQALASYASVRALARQNLDVVRETYELGRVTLGEVLAEQRRYLDIELGYTDALKMVFEARTILARALGEVR